MMTNLVSKSNPFVKEVKVPEIQLLLYCSRTKIEPNVAEKIKILLQQDINWSYLLHIANYHEVMPLLYWSLSNTYPELVPQDILTQLQLNFQANALRNQFLTQELLKILNLFEQHDILAIPFKGLTLAASTYGDVSLRQFRDLDILVRKQDYSKAKELIIRQGYQLFKQNNFLQQFSTASPLISKHQDISIDLHHRITSQYIFSRSFTFNHLWEQQKSIKLDSTSVPNLNPEDLFLYLCIHGSAHLFAKLLWICDLAELLRTHQDINWENMFQQAKKLGCTLMLLLGLSLANSFFSATLPEEIKLKISADPKIPVLVSQVHQQLFELTADPTQSYLQRKSGSLNRKFSFLFQLMEAKQNKVHLLLGFFLRHIRIFVKSQ